MSTYPFAKLAEIVAIAVLASMQGCDPQQPVYNAGYQQPTLQQPMLKQAPMHAQPVQPRVHTPAQVIQQEKAAEVIVQKPNKLRATPVFSDIPVKTDCDCSKEPITTKVEYKSGLCTWLLCLALGCTTGCCCFAFCGDCTKDRTHACPKCDKVLHEKKIL